MAEFLKKFSELPVVEVGENTEAQVQENGDFAKAKLFSGKYEDLQDKPFGDSVKVVFDGELSDDIATTVMGGAKAFVLTEEGEMVPAILHVEALGKTYELTLKNEGSTASWYYADGDEEPTCIPVHHTDEGKEIQITMSVSHGILYAIVVTELTVDDTVTDVPRIAVYTPSVNKLGWKYLPVSVIEGALADDGETVEIKELALAELYTAMVEGMPMILVLNKGAYNPVDIFSWRGDCFICMSFAGGQLLLREVWLSEDYTTGTYSETAYTLTSAT